MTPAQVIRVAVPAPLRTLFDYLPVPGEALPLPGTRVRVPFGRGERVGVVWEAGQPDKDSRSLKTLIEVLDPSPLLGAPDIALVNWAARYYQHPIGEVVAAAFPVRLRRGEAPAERTGWRATASGIATSGAGLERAPRQRAVLDELRAEPSGLSLQALCAARGGDVRGALARLLERGWVEPCSLRGEPATVRGVAGEGPPLHTEQASAVAEVAAASGHYQCWLLDGVTGSGKTEVYIELAKQVLAEGRQVLFLVPEISLTPQLVGRLTGRLDARFALFHSGLSEGARAGAWLAGATGDADILVGTRSALFAPLPRLGLVVVDEEHDPSFKQQEGFRYSARDLALVKARLADCPVVLGSATPSLESVANVDRGRYRRLFLARRAGGAVAPVLAVTDIRAQRLEGGLSPALIRAMRAELEAGNQVLLFLNRRGYAPVMTCHACGWVAQCPHCDARLTWHLKASRLWCHHCGFQRRGPETCPDCGEADLRTLGQGTERLEETLERLFPDVAIVRVDRDATRRKGRLETLLGAARSGEASLLVGTQMLAKGHHFPGVTLVGVLDADAGLFGVDFRAPERTAQLLYQVAGRAGRASRPGRVLIQTRHPDHPLLQCLLREGYGAFATAALAERKAARLPPFAHQVLIRAEASSAELPRTFLERLAAAAGSRGAGLDVWGPVPAPMERRGGRFRAHLLLQAPDRRLLQACLDRLVPGIAAMENAGRVRWSLDVDPVDLS